MKSDTKQLFLKSIKEDSPRVKLFKYRLYIPSNHAAAEGLREQMAKIALENKLVQQYRLIFELLKIKLDSTPAYNEINQKVTDVTNQLQKQQEAYKLEKNYQQLAATLLKLGRIYYEHSFYKECTATFDNIIYLNENSHRVQYEQYASQLALSYYFCNQSYNLSKFNSKPIDEAILKKSPDLCIIRDINNIQYRRNMDKPFSNVVKMGLSNLDLSKNRVMSYNDLGFLFSLLSIAYKKKEQIGFTKWSSKLQNSFMNNKYKIVLQTLKKQKQVRCFLPIINRVYESCQNQIKNRILTEIVSSFDRCPFKIIEQMTGLNEGQIRLFIKNNYSQEFLYDPITSSVVYKRKAPLLKQVKKLHAALQAKFNQEVATLKIKAQNEDDDDIGGLMRRGSGGRMGGMGGMGGMGRMMGMGRHRDNF